MLRDHPDDKDAAMDAATKSINKEEEASEKESAADEATPKPAVVADPAPKSHEKNNQRKNHMLKNQKNRTLLILSTT